MERVGAESCLFAPPLGCKRLPPEPGTQDPAGHRDEACFGAPADAAPVSAVGAVIGAASPISPPTGLTCTDAPPSRPHRPNALRVLQDLNVHSVAEWLGGHATAPHPAHREHDEVGPGLLVELQQQQVARDRDLEVLQGQLDQERERHSAFVQARWFEISSLEDQLVTSQEETLQQAVQRDVLLKTNIALEERGRGLEEQLQQMAPSRKHTEELEERCAHLERQVSSMEAEHALAVKLLRSDLCDADAAARRAERVCQEENSKSRQLEATVEKIDVTLSQVEADVRNGLKERDRLQGQATLFKERLVSIQDEISSLEDQLVTSQEETLQQAVQRDVLLKTNIALEERGRGLEEQLQQMAPSRKHTEELEERCAHLERQVSSMEAEHALAVKLLRSDLCDADAAARRAERVCQEENSKSRQLEATVEKIDVTLSQVEADVRNGLKERDRLQGQATLFKERLESIQDALAKDTLAEADKNVEDTKEHVEQELIRLKDMCLNQEKSFGTVLAARSARITELEDQLAQATQRVCRVEEDAESMKDGGNIDDTVAALQDRIKEHERNSREMDAEIAGLVVRNTLLRLSRVLCARKARALV